MKSFTSNEQTHKSRDNQNSYSGESSLGALHQNEQNRTRGLAQHDEQLRIALHETCEQLAIPDGIAASIADAGIARFIISADGTVKPLSSYPDLESFVKAHRSNAPSTPPTRMNAVQYADERTMRKTELFEQLKVFSAAGNMKAYRSARSEYAQL